MEMPETKPNWIRNHSTGQAVTQVTPTYIAYPSLCAAVEQYLLYVYVSIVRRGAICIVYFSISALRSNVYRIRIAEEQYWATLNSWHLTFLSSPTSPLICANSPNPRTANRAWQHM